MIPNYFYIIQSEDGASIVEYPSNAIPPVKGQILHLANITKDHHDVEVIQVEKIPEAGQILVLLTVKPKITTTSWPNLSSSKEGNDGE